MSASNVTPIVPILHAAYSTLKKPFAASELQRIEGVLGAMAQGKRLEAPDPRQQPTAVVVPGLSAKPFHDPAAFPWMKRLEEAADDIRREAMAIGDTEPSLQPYGTTYGVAETDDKWRVFYLRCQRAAQREHMARCPKTAQLIEALSMDAGEIYFSVLYPGMHIQAHHGVMNARLTCHLALEIPSDCAIRVSDETRSWENGKMMVFDDTYEHEAWNRSDRRRVVLLFDVWHPDLTLAEVHILSGLLDALVAAGAVAP